MTDTESTVGKSPSSAAKGSAGKGYVPDVPITVSTILDWPPRPVATLRHIASMMLPQGLIWVGIAVVVWNFFTPSMERMATLHPRWVLEIYVRNVVMFTLLAGTLHMVLYGRRAQQQRYKYNTRWLSSNPDFLWGDQTRDNIFWCLASGCAVWTVYESLTLWFYANDWIPSVEWSSGWLYLSALTVLTSLWSVTHFYCIHRVLHIRWVYDRVHYLHHRNVNPGPWSGLSMHPVEHMMYLSMFLLWWVVPAHPVILILTLSSNSLATAVTHSGFERFEIGRRGGRSMKGADYFHHLHHRFFECNYGNRPVPLDTLSGTFHDGTPEANTRMRERMRARRGPRTVKQP